MPKAMKKICMFDFTRRNVSLKTKPHENCMLDTSLFEIMGHLMHIEY